MVCLSLITLKINATALYKIEVCIREVTETVNVGGEGCEWMGWLALALSPLLPLLLCLLPVFCGKALKVSDVYVLEIFQFIFDRRNVL